MAHNLATEANGQRSYIGAAPAWHGLGIVKEHLMTFEEVKSEGILSWVPEKRVLTNPYTGEPISLHGIFRSDNHAYLGNCSAKANPISHHKGIETLVTIVGEERCLETAGSLGNGETVWALASLGESSILGDDISKDYLLYRKAYDQTVSDMWKLVKTRVVCQNTINIALRESGACMKVRNTKNSEIILKERLALFESIKAQNAEVNSQLTTLANRRASKETIESLLEHLYKLTPKKDANGNDILDSPTRRNNIVTSILARYEDNDKNAFPSQRGTLYNLLNAVTGFVDHDRSVKEERTAEQAMFGSGDAIKTKAFNFLLEAAKTSEVKEQSTLYVPVSSSSSLF